MATKKRKDIVSLLVNIQKKIIAEKPPYQQMFEEVRMMKFKIRPLQGDISLVNVQDIRLIELLWNLGKLDEFFQKELRNLSPQDEEMVFTFFDNVYQQFQNKLNELYVKKEKNTVPTTLEMEIFRDVLEQKKAN